MAIKNPPPILGCPEARNLNAYKPLEQVKQIQLNDLTDATARNVLAELGNRLGSPIGQLDDLQENAPVFDYLARTVMRRPSPEARTVLTRLHRKMNHLLRYSNWTLEWLLGGSRKRAYGGFADVNSLKAFLERVPDRINSEQLIRGIETLLTAMAYRMVGAKWAEPPFLPETKDEKSLVQKVLDASRPFIVPPIDEAYPERQLICDADEDPNADTVAIPILQRMASNFPIGQGITPNVPFTLPPYALPVYDGPAQSWSEIAYKSGISVHAHPSGTWPLCLAVACGLLFDKPQLSRDLHGALTPESLKQFEELTKAAELLTGVLAVPTYLRGDFHSPAETAVGLKYFLMVLQGVPTRDAYIQPIDAIHHATQLMVAASFPTVRNQIQTVPQDVRNFSTQENTPLYDPQGLLALPRAEAAQPAAAALPRGEDDEKE